MHVLARLSGHGVVVLPHPSYRLQRVAGGPETTLRVSRGEATGVVDVLAALQTKSALVDVSEGGGEGPWRIETGIFTCPWPRGFDLTGDDASPFLLWGPGDALIWVDGPVPEERTTPLDKLVGPGQRIRATSSGRRPTRRRRLCDRRRFLVAAPPRARLGKRANARRHGAIANDRRSGDPGRGQRSREQNVAVRAARLTMPTPLLVRSR